MDTQYVWLFLCLCESYTIGIRKSHLHDCQVRFQWPQKCACHQESELRKERKKEDGHASFLRPWLKWMPSLGGYSNGCISNIWYLIFFRLQTIQRPHPRIFKRYPTLGDVSFVVIICKGEWVQHCWNKESVCIIGPFKTHSFKNILYLFNFLHVVTLQKQFHIHHSGLALTWNNNVT